MTTIDRLAQFKILKEIEQHPAYSHIHRNDFLSSELLIHSPLLLPDMEKAILLVEKAINSNQKILIAGDRDVDGVTSTVLLTSYLRRCSALVDYVNSSDGDDYGLTGSFLDRLCQSDAGLVILLDMGSGHLNEAAQILAENRDVIILDHHVPTIPDGLESKLSSIAFVNPRLSKFINELDHEGKIATVGLAFKLILGIEMKKLGLWNQCIIIDLSKSIIRNKNDVYEDSPSDIVIYRTGAFLERTTETVDQCQKRLIEQGFKPSVHTIQELQNQCLLLKERSADEWYTIIDASPVQFGRYLFSCSLLHRDNLFLRLLGEADLTSIGLVADMVPLLGENRSVVSLGLGSERSKYANKLKIPASQLIRPGLLALMYEAGLDPFDTSTKDLNFTINPIINAAGRLGKTEKALDLLLCENKQQARLLAADLVKLNRQRKQRTQRNQQIVDSNFSIEESDSIAFFYHTDLEPGVSGIMATRLLEMTGKSVVWVNPDGVNARGSARSLGGLNMLELLNPLAPYLVQLGGHNEACGFTIEYNRIHEFSEALIRRANQYIKENSNQIECHDNRPIFEISAADLSVALLKELEILEPFGQGNPEPVLLLNQVTIENATALKSGNHLKFSIIGAPSNVECIYWNCSIELQQQVIQSNQKLNSTQLWNLTGNLEKNRFANMKPIRFRLDSIEPAN